MYSEKEYAKIQIQNNKNEKLDKIFNAVINDRSLMSFVRLNVFLNHKDNDVDLETNLQFWFSKIAKDKLFVSMELWCKLYSEYNIQFIFHFLTRQKQNIDFVSILKKLNFSEGFIGDLEKKLSQYTLEQLEQEEVTRLKIAQEASDLALAKAIQDEEVHFEQEEASKRALAQQMQARRVQNFVNPFVLMNPLHMSLVNIIQQQIQQLEIGKENIIAKMTHEQFDQLPEKIFTQQEQDQDEKEGCIVCNVDYKDGDKLKVLSCKHEFHEPCIAPWLTKEKNNCPICRAKQQVILKP